MRTGIAFLVAASLTVSGPCALAQASSSSQAQTLFERGRESVKKGQFLEALDTFIRSYELDPKPGTLLNLSLCEDKIGHLVSARSHLRKFLDGAPGDDDRRQLAMRHLDDIDQRVPHLTVKLNDKLNDKMAPTTVVELDGAALDRLTLQSPLLLDPGEHTLVLTGASGTVRRTTFQLKERQDLIQSVVWVEQVKSPDVSPIASKAKPVMGPPGPVERGTPVAGVAFGTVGVAAAVGTTLCAFEVLWNKRLVEQHCGANGCDGTAHEASDAGKKWSLGGTVMAGLSLVGLGAGAYLLFFTGPKGKTAAAPSNAPTLGLRLGSTGAILAVSGPL